MISWLEEKNRLQKILIKQLESDEYLKQQHSSKELEQNIRDRDKKIANQVEPEIKKKSVREKLCPILDRGVTDVFDIAKPTVPILISLAVAGAISISVSPAFIVAGAALLIARMTVAKYCPDDDTSH